MVPHELLGCRVGCSKGETVFMSSLLCIILLSRIDMPYMAYCKPHLHRRESVKKQRKR